MLPLTRTAALADFPGCCSVADWQQQVAIAAYQAWAPPTTQWGPPAFRACTLNWGAAAFVPPGGRPDTAVYVGYGDPLPTSRVDTIYALSVLDRTDAPIRFLRESAHRLRPGGLLVCTFAAWDADGADCAIGCELRARIYNRTTWRKLLDDLHRIGLAPFGGVDLRYRGDTLGDHTLATLVAVTPGVRHD